MLRGLWNLGGGRADNDWIFTSSGTKETAFLRLQSLITWSLCGLFGSHHSECLSVSPVTNRSHLQEVLPNRSSYRMKSTLRSTCRWNRLVLLVFPALLHTHTSSSFSPPPPPLHSVLRSGRRQLSQSASQMETPESLAFPRHGADCACQHEQRAPWGHGRVGLTTPVGSFQPLWLVVSMARERHQNRRVW